MIVFLVLFSFLYVFLCFFSPSDRQQMGLSSSGRAALVLLCCCLSAAAQLSPQVVQILDQTRHKIEASLPWGSASPTCAAAVPRTSHMTVLYIAPPHYYRLLAIHLLAHSLLSSSLTSLLSGPSPRTARECAPAWALGIWLGKVCNGVGSFTIPARETEEGDGQTERSR